MARLLLIDDEKTILVVLRALFKASGFDVITCQGGKQAEDLIKSGGFDLVISDIRMNPINGLDFLQLSRADHPETPVIMVSAYGSEGTKDEVIRLGGYGFLRKPFDNLELLSMAKAALASRESPAGGDPASR